MQTREILSGNVFAKTKLFSIGINFDSKKRDSKEIIPTTLFFHSIFNQLYFAYHCGISSLKWNINKMKTIWDDSINESEIDKRTSVVV